MFASLLAMKLATPLLAVTYVTADQAHLEALSFGFLFLFGIGLIAGLLAGKK
jgi:hypothetical protein